MPPQMIAGERPIAIIRQHWIGILPNIFAAFVAFVIGWVVIGFIPDELAGHHVGGFRGLFRLVLLVVVVGAGTGAWLRWRYQNYVLTDHRIVVSRGVVARETESIALDRIQDIRVRQTLSARMIHCGDVEIDVAGRDGSEVLHFVPEPQTFANELIAAVEGHRLGQFGSSPQPALGAAQPRFPGSDGGAPRGQQSAAPPEWLAPQPEADETAGDRFRRGDGPYPPPVVGPPGSQRGPAGPAQPPFDPPEPEPPDAPAWGPRPGDGL